MGKKILFILDGKELDLHKDKKLVLAYFEEAIPKRKFGAFIREDDTHTYAYGIYEEKEFPEEVFDLAGFDHVVEYLNDSSIFVWSRTESCWEAEKRSAYKWGGQNIRICPDIVREGWKFV